MAFFLNKRKRLRTAQGLFWIWISTFLATSAGIVVFRMDDMADLSERFGASLRWCLKRMTNSISSSFLAARLAKE